LESSEPLKKPVSVVPDFVQSQQLRTHIHFIRLHDERIPRLKELEREWENLGDKVVEPAGY
jgi:hypothetical protein